ncbi:hypothetical protein KR50_33870 [Jeotgalibacillus campisalis]|uniref:Uncharacterized protein n=1 Tax=Jeotgalibacillus campisalis TaxID=220754 RepID=A0A0C2QY84_9BACL|nr:hypothetical protein KR50_33870 [Jeotgalibacillus campisalis]
MNKTYLRDRCLPASFLHLLTIIFFKKELLLKSVGRRKAPVKKQGLVN